MTPLDAALYASVKAEAKKRFRRWPSAYGSAWLSREYRARGGRYAGHSPGGVRRWMREEWVQVGPALEGKKIPCGNRSSKGKACRPSKRISPRTPLTVSEVVKRHGTSKVRRLASRKSRDMKGRVDWRRGTFRSKRKRK